VVSCSPRPQRTARPRGCHAPPLPRRGQGGGGEAGHTVCGAPGSCLGCGGRRGGLLRRLHSCAGGCERGGGAHRPLAARALARCACRGAGRGVRGRRRPLLVAQRWRARPRLRLNPLLVALTAQQPLARGAASLQRRQPRAQRALPRGEGRTVHCGHRRCAVRCSDCSRRRCHEQRARRLQRLSRQHAVWGWGVPGRACAALSRGQRRSQPLEQRLGRVGCKAAGVPSRTRAVRQ